MTPRNEANGGSPSPPPVRWIAAGETAVVVEFGRQDRIDDHVLPWIWALASDLNNNALPGLKESVPAFSTLTLLIDPLVTEAAAIGPAVERAIARLAPPATWGTRVVEIPVCYDEDFGPDLEFVAQHNRLSVSEVVAEHLAGDYLVQAIGFAPGFPYLGGLSSRIAAPRRDTPRLEVPPGSVAIAGEQTGIYPLRMPGGWRLIGRTPLPLFRPERVPPSRLQPGDRVRFRPISREEFVRTGSEAESCRSE